MSLSNLFPMLLLDLAKMRVQELLSELSKSKDNKAKLSTRRDAKLSKA